MNTQSYLIDTNVIIGLEDNHTVHPAYAKLSQLAEKHKVDVFIHEVSRDDIKRDKEKNDATSLLANWRSFKHCRRSKASTSKHWLMNLARSVNTMIRLMPHSFMR